MGIERISGMGAETIQLVTLQLGFAFILACGVLACVLWLMSNSTRASRTRREVKRQRRALQARLERIVSSR